MKNAIMALLVGLGLLAFGCGSTVCDANAAAQCGVTFDSCLQKCVDDTDCQQNCKTTYCDCLDSTNCADTTDECD